MIDQVISKLRIFSSFIISKYVNYVLLTVFVCGLFLGFCFGFWYRSLSLNNPDDAAISEVIAMGNRASVGLISSVEGVVEDTVSSDGESVCVEVAGAVMVPGVYCLDSTDLVINAVNMAGGLNLQSYADRYVSRSMNLARPLIAHEKIYIPFQDEQVCALKEFAYVEDNSQSKELSLLEQIKSVLDAITENVTNLDGDISQKVEDLQKQIDETDPYDTDGSGGNEGGSDSDTSCINLNSATLDELISISGVGESTAQKIIDARPFEAVEELLDVSGIGDAKYAVIKESVCL